MRLPDFKKLKNALLTKKAAVIMIAAGALLVLAGAVFVPSAGTAASEGVDTESYRQSLEKQLCRIVENIKGAGDCEVMITLKSAGEYVYATEQNNSTASMNDDGRSEYKDGSERRYITVRDGSGGESAVILKELLPEVRGAVIVCEGADDPSVKSDVISAAAALLGVPSNNVCVIKKR